MTPEEVAEKLSGTVFGTVRFVTSTGSTNADLLAAARLGAPEGIVVVADHQTAGRGRRGRTWVAPTGAALLASVLLRPRWADSATGAATRAIGLLSPAGALAVRAACAEAGADVKLKWPNDVITQVPSETTDPSEAKLAGVLAELYTDPEGAAAPAVVLGFGVNLRAQTALSEALAALPTSEGADDFRPLPPVALETVVAHLPSRDELLVSVLRHLDAYYRRLQEPDGTADLLALLRCHSATLGRRVHLLTPDGTVTGTAEDFTDDGRLVVATSAGRVLVAAGDCHHLRSERR